MFAKVFQRLIAVVGNQAVCDLIGARRRRRKEGWRASFVAEGRRTGCRRRERCEGIDDIECLEARECSRWMGRPVKVVSCFREKRKKPPSVGLQPELRPVFFFFFFFFFFFADARQRHPKSKKNTPNSQTSIKIRSAKKKKKKERK